MKDFFIFIVRACVIAVILLNIYSIHTFNATVAPWYSIFYAPGILALIALAIIISIIPISMYQQHS